MLQRGRSTSVHPLIALFVGLALTACSDPARSQDAGTTGTSAGTPLQANAAVDTALNMYAALEYCDVDGDRLEKLKQDMKDLANQQRGTSSAEFDAAFEAGLPTARQAVESEAAANPAETKKFCQAERGGA